MNFTRLAMWAMKSSTVIMQPPTKRLKNLNSKKCLVAKKISLAPLSKLTPERAGLKVTTGQTCSTVCTLCGEKRVVTVSHNLTTNRGKWLVLNRQHSKLMDSSHTVN